MNGSQEAACMRENLKRLEEECIILKKAAEGRKQDFKTLQGIQNQLNETCAAQEAELRKLRAQCASLQKRLEDEDKLHQEVRRLKTIEHELRTQCEIQKQELTSLREASEKQAKECEAKFVQMKRQEERLNRYSCALNRWRASTKNLCIQFSKELEKSQTLHPLHDYLALTEFELSKIEIQVMKTPTLSSDRRKLEAYLAQLVEQRDFLKTTIEASKKQLEKQAQELLRFNQMEKLGPVPPPLPVTQ